MDAKLVVTSGAQPAKISLRLPTVIGRSADAQLKVKQHNVSRRHCEIFAAAGQLKIRDLGSSNGTFINGQRIEGDFVLSPGDELTLGTVQLCVIFQTAPTTGTSTNRANQPTVVAAEPSKRREEALDRESVDHVDLLGGSAVLNYQDLEDGSFIAIKLAEPLPKPVDSAIHLDVESKALADESQIQLDIADSDAVPIDDDSRLHSFLEGLGED